MAKNYNPPPSINPETVRLMGDAKKKESENNLDGIIAEAAKIERFIEFGSVPPKKK